MPERPQNRWCGRYEVCVFLWSLMVLNIARLLLSRQRAHLCDPIALMDVIVISIFSQISFSLLCRCYNLCPGNWFLLLLLTTFFAWTVAVVCAYACPVVPIIRAATSTSGLVLGLILFAIWAGNRGYDLNFLATLLLPWVVEILVFTLIQPYFPPWRTFMQFCSGFRILVCCAYIVSFISNLMCQPNSEDNILDLLSLFFTIVTLFVSFINMTFDLSQT